MPSESRTSGSTALVRGCSWRNRCGQLTARSSLTVASEGQRHRIGGRRCRDNNCGGAGRPETRRRDTLSTAGLPSRTSRWTRVAPAARARSTKCSSSSRADAAPLMVGRDREQQQFGFAGDRADSEKPGAAARARRRASATRRSSAGSRRIATGSMPRRSGSNAASMIAMTASRSRDPPGTSGDLRARASGVAHQRRDRGRGHRARGHRSAAARGSAGLRAVRSASAARGQAATRLAPAARGDQARRARSDHELGASIRAAASPGGRLCSGVDGASGGVELLDEQLAVAAGIAAATAPVRWRRRRAAPATTFPRARQSQPIARPCAAAIADPDAGEAAGPDADQDAASASRPSSNSSIIGTSRSAWPRPISSSRWATQLPRRRTRRRCRRRSTCRSQGSSHAPC